MEREPRIVLSASRRTDIPAFYLPWFMACIKRGFFEVINPYNRKETVVPVSTQRVHTIVFWSKDLGPFLADGSGEALEAMGYHLYFNFTVNSENRLLEARVPPLEKRLAQMAELCRRFDPRAVAWRFDPVCFYSCAGGPEEDNTTDFCRIAETAARSGIQRCITSFMDDYAKIRKRVRALDRFRFIDPTLERKRELLSYLADRLAPLGIGLEACCEKEVIDGITEAAGVRPASCIPNDRIAALYGGRLSMRKDAGQRAAKGCGCMVSVDIGSYGLHPCHHRCLYCYANPAKEGGSPVQP